MTPQEIIKWLNICATDCHAEECKQCPYNKDDYEDGCGKLLADAALLLTAAYGADAITTETTVNLLGEKRVVIA